MNAGHGRGNRHTGHIAGDTLLLNVLSDGATLFISIANGLGCHRMIAGPKLHKVIMGKIARQWM